MVKIDVLACVHKVIDEAILEILESTTSLIHKERYNRLLDPQSFLDYKHLSIKFTHKAISGEIVRCTVCTMFPSGLPGGMIVLDAFVGNLLRYELGSSQEEKERYNQKMVMLLYGTT